MEQFTTVETSFGKFKIKNELTVGEKRQIAITRARLSEGLFGQMISSPATEEVIPAIEMFRTCELDGRIDGPPPEWKGCSELTSEQLAELWKGWTEKSGMFLRADTGEGQGTSGQKGSGDQEGSTDGNGDELSPGVVSEEVQSPGD